MKKHMYIFTHTISGEGYTEPKFKLFSDVQKARTHMKRVANKLIKSGCQQNKNHLSDKQFTFEEPMSNGNEIYDRLQLFRVEYKPFYLIEFTEPNEIEITKCDKFKQAQTGMIEGIGMRPLDSGEELYQGEMEYGAHFEDGYVHWKIIKTNISKQGSRKLT